MLEQRHIMTDMDLILPFSYSLQPKFAHCGVCVCVHFTAVSFPFSPTMSSFFQSGKENDKDCRNDKVPSFSPVVCLLRDSNIGQIGDGEKLWVWGDFSDRIFLRAP